MPLKDLLLPGDPPVHVHVRRSNRARRLTLRVSSLDGKVTMTVPSSIKWTEIEDFAAQKVEWIRKSIGNSGACQSVGFGVAIPILGEVCDIRPGSGRLPRLVGTELQVPGHPDRVGARVLGFIKTLARNRLAEASDRYAELLGAQYTGITLRDTRSRWGSCTSDRRLMYSWRLVLAPVDVLEYVAAHEVAHLREMNHSGAFWSLVSDLYGDYSEPRDWLRREGAALHRFRFED